MSSRQPDRSGGHGARQARPGWKAVPPPLPTLQGCGRGSA